MFSIDDKLQDAFAIKQVCSWTEVGFKFKLKRWIFMGTNVLIQYSEIIIVDLILLEIIGCSLVFKFAKCQVYLSENRGREKKHVIKIEDLF